MHTQIAFSVFSVKYSASSGLELTLFKEDELIHKWLEILGQHNEVVVGVAWSFESTKITLK